MYNTLTKHPLFEGIVLEDIKHILTCMDSRRQHFEKGTLIFVAYNSAPKIGILLSGKAQIVKENYHGDRMIIGIVTPGSLFGETYASMDLSTIPVSVETLENSLVLLLDVNRILKICENTCPFHQKLISNLLKIIATKNMQLNKKMSYITHKTIRGRLLAYLEDQSENAQSERFDIPFNRNELAEYLCIDRSAMSRELSRMKKEGLLNFSKKTFHLQV